MARRVKNGNGEVNVAEESAQADRIAEMAEKKKSALELLAEANAMARDLGVESEETPDRCEDTEPYPAPVAQIQEEPPAEPTEAEKLESIIDELSKDEGRFEIFRVVSGQDRKVGSYPISDWPERLDTVAESFGGGEFRVKFKRATGLYAKQITRFYEAKEGGAVANREAPKEDNSFRFFEMMERRDAEHRKEMMMLQEKMLMMQMKTLEMSRGDGGFVKTAQDLKAMQEMMQPKEPKSAMDNMREVFEIIALLKNGGEVIEPPSPLQSAIDKAFRLLQPLLEAGVAKMAVGSASARQPAQALPAPASPPSVGVAVSPATPASSNPSQEAGNQVIGQHAQALLQAITNGMTPDAVAAFILCNLKTDEEFTSIEKFANDPAMTGHLIQAEPGLAAHQGWVAQMMLALKDQLAEDDTQEEEKPAEATVVKDVTPVQNT